MSEVKAPLAPGYYWYQAKPGSKAILVEVHADEVYSTEWSEHHYLPCGEAVDPPFLTSYATGVYAGPITVPEDLTSCGLPIVTVTAGPDDA